MGAKRSGFEERMGAVLEPEGFSYEPTSIDYSIPKKYTPDFHIQLDGYYDIYVEAKGWFRPGDTQKYAAIASHCRYNMGSVELVFLLQYPDKKVRKGAVLTMSGWCDKHDIRWFGCPEGLIAYAEGLK